MNEFERAMAKTDKREQRKTLHLSPSLNAEPDCPPVAVPKEKRPNIDAVIHVAVSLPYDSFYLTFTKMNVMGMKRLSKAEFEKAITEGLRPLLGTVK